MEKNLYDLTSAQNSIWLTEQFSSNTSLNNIGGYVFIQDTVNFDYLEKSLKLYVQKNDALNLRIQIVDGQPKQYLSDFEDFKIQLIELQNIEEVKQLNANIINTSFSFLDSNLYKITMFKLPNGTGGFNATLHHIISDAWNMSLLINEVMDCYSSFCNSNNVELTSFPSYIDSIESECNYFESERFQKDKEFWNSMFSSSPELTYINPNKNNNNNSVANRKIFDLDADLYNRISKFCKAYSCSIYTFFMAIYSLYISKVNNTHSAIIGTPVLNRSNFKEKHTAGMFISTVPFKININPNDSFTSFLKDVTTTQLGIFRHQKYPYGKLLEDIKKEYNISDNLYDFVLSYQNAKDDKNTSDINYSSTWLFNGYSLDTLQIHFYDMDNNGTPKLYYDYQIDKLNECDVNNINNRIVEMCNIVLGTPSILLSSIPVITLHEKENLLSNFNTTFFDFDKEKTLVSLFEEQVSMFPYKSAVIFEDVSLTYSKLNSEANLLANLLIQNNIKNSIIGIMLPRSSNILVSVWAILKSGNGYMLIDPALPEERVEYMLSNANAKLLITNSGNDFNFKNKFFIDSSVLSLNNISKAVNLNDYSNENSSLSIDNNDTFCIIYTSGSTGTPKGVELKRIGILNMLHSYKHFLYTDTCDTFLSTSTVSFDMFIVENFVSLLSGKTVILANEEQQKVPVFMSELIKKYNVDFILSTPSKISLLLLNDDIKGCLKNVKIIQLGGEVFKEHLYRELIKCSNAKIFNGYGPSECTACCSNKEIIDADNITIGKPFLNTKIYLLNSDMNILPIGYSGEICVAGLGVGNGYIHNSELTNKSFVTDPFMDNSIIYRTGDIGRYSFNGDLIYVGRQDAQVKLRGLRIELDEITNKILTMDSVVNAISVIKKVNNINCICSYIIKSNTSLTEDMIKQYLSDKLPYYMIPSHIVFLDAFPITINGKIDIKKLPDIVINTLDYIAPKNDTEIALANLWSKILGVEHISTNMNFFDLGGDSLCSIKLISEVYSLLNLKISIKDIFRYPTISSLAEYIESTISTHYTANIVDKAPLLNAYPLSSAQKRIYYTVQLNPESVNYNTPGGIIFKTCPDINKLEKCFNELINRHSSLRTYFTVENNEVVQKIVDAVTFSLNVVHSEGKTPDEIFNTFVQPFDLRKAPLLRLSLHVFSSSQFILFMDMHHIICDGESISIFIDELCKLYNDISLPNNQLDYIDYAVWENNNLKSNYYESSKAYWLSQFSDDIPVLNMPTTYSRPNTQCYDGSKVYNTIPYANKIFDLCKELNTTPYIFLLTVYYILLYKYTGQNNIIVGSPIVGRDNASLSEIIGMFVNTIALKAHINSSDTFKTLLSYVTANCFNAFENQTYPFNELLNQLNIVRDTSRNPLFDTMFIYQNNGIPQMHLDNMETEYYIPDNHTSKFDFSLEISPEGNNLKLSLEYCTKLFDKQFMSDFLSHYIGVLNTIINNTNISVSDINVLSHTEIETILNDFNNNDLDYPSDKTIIDLFNEQVFAHPNNYAVTYKDIKLTYMDLQKHVEKLSAYLSYLGITKGDIVCTLLPRSADLIITLLAIMKCGAIYLPISIAFPTDRINYIIENSNSKLIVTNSSIEMSIQGELLQIDHIDYMNFDNTNYKAIKLYPDDIIYTIYTSGSTGEPKGVQITNNNLNNFIHSFKNLFDYSVTYNDICLSTTNIAFDVSIWEFFFTLLNGANLCLYEKESIDDIFDYCNCIIEYKITMAYIPPNILEEVYTILMRSKSSVYLDKILVGVESIKTDTILKYFSLNPNMKIVNGYGPTETTICTTAFKVTASANIPYHVIPIGKPLNNMNAYILDSDLNLLPIRVPGELYVSGDNVGHGYLNNIELTNTRFITSPFNSNAKMYKTGDIVKWLPSGNLMFVGRNDSQIKIKGHRIEINEIVSAISEYPSITKCVVLVKEKNDNKFLIAYFTASKKIIVNDLRSFLALKLPFYNIPNFFIQLDKFNLTVNGKIDFNYLRNMDLQLSTVYEAPRSTFEKQMVELWKDFLNVEQLGINDNFFDLGGDSLIAIKLQIEAFKLGISISYGDIFAYPTIKQLSQKVPNNQPVVNLHDYDYSTINELISNNKLPICNTLNTLKITGILLTGVTGFVGAHILDKLLTNTNTTIYCLVRAKDNIDYVSRLKRTLHFYFNKKYDRFIGNRIKIIEGDITKSNLGLLEADYNQIGNNVSCIINSAAIVKHYGSSHLFDNTNIDGVKNIISFCTSFHIRLFHISTLSVSGNVFAEDNFSGSQALEKVTFKENNLFVGQDLSNIYIYTKFVAERLILEHISNGDLVGTIIRLGNITSRLSDGHFQINISENAFLNRLLSFMQLKCIPDYLMNGYAEFTPVDCCADAISKIIEYDVPYTILHLFNNNHITISNIINILDTYGFHIDIVDNDTFIKSINYALQSDKNMLSGIINDFDENKKLVYESNITLNNNFTNDLLEKINFKWPQIDKTYIYQYLDYLKNIGYIKY